MLTQLVELVRDDALWECSDRKSITRLNVRIDCFYRNRITHPLLPDSYTMQDQGADWANASLARSQFITSTRGPAHAYVIDLVEGLKLIPVGWAWSMGQDAQGSWAAVHNNHPTSIMTDSGQIEKNPLRRIYERSDPTGRATSLLLLCRCACEAKAAILTAEASV